MTVATVRRDVGHRRGSSQTLTLDLEGLDLGRGGYSDTTLEPTKEEVTGIRSLGTSPTAFTLNGFSRPWVAAGRPSTDASRHHFDDYSQKHKAGGAGGEDSFFAHLRNCEDSNVILRTEEVLPVAAAADTVQTKSIRKDSGSIPGDSSKQVLGGFASLGYDSNANSRNNLHYYDMDNEASGSNSLTTSPRYGGQGSLNSPWKTLVPIMHDPMDTLDILSIEEMGLHSIDVGSKEDWDGVTLSYPCETCDQIAESESCKGVDAQWTVARSTKRQRKWIVTPRSHSSSRTVVVSDHITYRQDQKREQRPSLEGLKTFSNQSTFELRFLQAGSSAPNNTILLASPATHRMLAAKDDAAPPKTSISLDTSPILNSLGVHEEQSRPAATSAAMQSTTSQDNDENWPALRSKAAKVAKRQSRALLLHSKSSSTIHATAPMVQLESRRPSLGKSISHESLAFTSSPSRTALPISNSCSPRASMSTSTESHTPNKSLPRTSSSGSFPRSPLVDNLPTESFTAFGDYSIGLNPKPLNSKTNDSPNSQTNSGPSPRTSMHDTRSSSHRWISESPRTCERTPVMSIIDPARLAEYQRFQSANSLSNSNSALLQSNPSWQAALSSSPMAKSSLRKDRRLSDWIKKKVMPNGNDRSTALAPPLPPAWEQKRDQQLQQQSLPSPSTIRVAPPKSSKSNTIKVAKALSNTSKSSGTTTTSSSGVPISPIMTPLEGSDNFFITESPITTSLPFLFQGKTTTDIKEVDLIKSSLDVPATMFPLSQMQTYHGYNVWPGVVSVRNERRRSNSDDNLALLGESEKRRLEVLGKEGAARKGRMTSLRTNAMGMAESDDLAASFSTSMPSHSVMDLYGELSRRQVPERLTSIDLLGLEDVPSHSITMMIPLALGKNVDEVPLRYVRVSFVPFESDSMPEEDSSRESMDLLPPSALNGHHNGGASSNWYKKLTNAWNSSSSARSSSTGSNEEDQDSRPSCGGAAAVTNEDCYATFSDKRRNSTVDSFRIIAKVLDNPLRQSSSLKTLEESRIPAAIPFPVILGVCDRQRSLKLIPEGWEAINLASGPTQADTDSPLEGLADLIIAGCAACMDL